MNRLTKVLFLFLLLGVFGLFSTAEASATVVFNDNFDRLDSPVLSNGWVEDIGDWSIFSDELVSPVQNSAIIHNVNSPSSPNYYVQVVAKSSNPINGSPAVLARFIDSNNFYLFQSANGQAHIYKRVNGQWTILNTQPFKRAGDIFNVYRIEVYNNRINGYIDGILAASATDDSITATGTGGIRRGGLSSSVIFDNYEVAEISSLTSPQPSIPSSTFFIDNFDRPDSFILGDGWIEDKGNWQINLNQLVPQILDDVIVHNTASPPSRNYYVQVDGKSVDSALEFPAILARFIDSNNFYLFQIGNGQALLYKRVNGQWTILDSKEFMRQANKFYSIRIQVKDNEIGGYINESQVVYATDNSLSDAGFGAIRRGGDHVSIVFDNFVMGDLTLPPIESSGFNLPFDYPGRDGVDEETFKNTFWERMTAVFDHEFEEGTFTSFLGNTRVLPTDKNYRDNESCPSPEDCYDSHNAIDFTSRKGENVLSAGSGEVAYASLQTTEIDPETGEIKESCKPLNNDGFGCVVVLKHSESLYSMYAHLKHVDVIDGENVTEETTLGQMGNSGCSKNGCPKHLHFAAMQPKLSTLLQVNLMTRSDWESLLVKAGKDEYAKEAKKAEKDKFKYNKYGPFCDYHADNNATFTFQDPSGWYGEGSDPWESSCGVASPSLWKYSVEI